MLASSNGFLAMEQREVATIRSLHVDFPLVHYKYAPMSYSFPLMLLTIELEKALKRSQSRY
jgi:hypothetical protein